MNIGILEPKDFSQMALKSLSRLGVVERYNNENLDKFLFNKEVLFIRLSYFLDKDFLRKLNKIKYICTPTTGLNHIDIEECDKRKIKVVSLKGEYDFLTTIRATPEHTFGLTISLLRKYKKALSSDAIWDRDMYKGVEIYNNFVGIIGFGRIGKILAEYFSAFGANVYYYDTGKSIQNDTKALRVDSIEGLMKKTNIVILSASYKESNRNFFGSKCIELLRDKFFINISRGELVDENFLLKKIEENFFKGVALDVISNEQGENNFKKFKILSEKTNTIITPHIGGATYDSMELTEEFVVKKLIKDMK
jgi:D-3-phosphoglycerate dehydrogenase